DHPLRRGVLAVSCAVFCGMECRDFSGARHPRWLGRSAAALIRPHYVDWRRGAKISLLALTWIAPRFVFGVVVGLMEKFVMAEGSLAGANLNCPGGSAFTTKLPVEWLLIAGESVAAFRDEQGIVHALSAVCSHMGCTVGWNEIGRTWDCP